MSAHSADWLRPDRTTNVDALASAASGVHAICETARELNPGSVVSGKYRVRGELGRGGFAVVYDAEHLGLRRAVALKVLHRGIDTPALLIERFAREAHISALVRHPHVLQVYDVGVLSDGSPFLVMEKIQGETLQHHLCLAGRLTIDQTVELTGQLLSALVALAAHGIVHRDIKPDNLMITYTDSGELSLKLVDFGVALVRDERIEPRLTMHGALVGTPHYMAPEQLRSEVVDARIDIYAAGVVMFQALTGSLPYDGKDLCALTLNVLHGEEPNLRALRPDCPARLARVVERALSRDAGRRFASAADMLAVLESSAADSTSTCLAARRSWSAISLQPARARAVSLTIGVAALTGCLLWTPWLRGATRPEPSRLPFRSSAQSADWGPLKPEVVQLTEIVPAAQALAESSTSAGASPASARPDPVQATSYCRKALDLYLHGELEAAHAAYRKAARANPLEPAAFRGIGLSAARLGKRHEARRAYSRYLELEPRAADAALVRARLDELSVSATDP